MTNEPRQLSENWREEWLEAGRRRESWRDVVREAGRFAWQFRMAFIAGLIVSPVVALISRLG
jgi:hypothetical protein